MLRLGLVHRQTSRWRHPDQLGDKRFNDRRDAPGDQRFADAFARAGEVLALLELDFGRKRFGAKPSGDFDREP